MSMRKLAAASVAAAMILMSAPAMAATITFSQSGFAQNGVLTGTFVGTSSNGTFTRNDITSYDVRFRDDSGRNLSGGFLQPDFSFNESTSQIKFGVGYAGSSVFASYSFGTGLIFDRTYSERISVAPVVSFTPDVVASAVPEPFTWAMLLVGFGMVGVASRYRRRGAKVTFA